MVIKSEPLSNPHLMGILASGVGNPSGAIRSKDMADKSLKQELGALRVPHLRKIAHKIHGKGSWISMARKEKLIRSLIEKSDDHDQIMRLVHNENAEVKLERRIITPRVRRLCQLISEEIGRNLVHYMKAEEGETPI